MSRPPAYLQLVQQCLREDPGRTRAAVERYMAQTVRMVQPDPVMRHWVLGHDLGLGQSEHDKFLGYLRKHPDMAAGVALACRAMHHGGDRARAQQELCELLRAEWGGGGEQ